MTVYNVLAVAPYYEFLELTEIVAKEFSNIHLETFCGNLDNALNYVLSLPANRYNVILSRGGTAVKLRAASVPVVSTDVSAYDILCTIRQVQQFCSEFAIVGYANIVRAAKNICGILQWTKVKIVEVNADIIEESIADLVRSGISVIAGDVISVETAKKHGIRGVLITSSADSIRKGLEDAIDMCHEIQRYQEQYVKAMLTLDNLDVGSLLLDENGTVCLTNSVLRAMDYDAACLEARKILKTGKTSIRTWRKFRNAKVEISMVSIAEGGRQYFLFLFRNTYVLSDTAQSITVEDYATLLQNLHFLFLGQEYVYPLLDRMNAACNQHTPILITGPDGVELSSFARYIHKISQRSGQPFIRLRCNRLTQRQWEQLCNGADSVLMGSNCTVFFENIHLLSETMQEVVTTYLNDTDLLRKHFIIATGLAQMTVSTVNKCFSEQLYKCIAGTVLKVPPLAERQNDLPTLSSLYIAMINNECGTQVIGAQPDAVKLLSGYTWPQNLDQFHIIIRQLVTESGGYYITADQVERVLQDCTTENQHVQAEINYNQTLDQIEKNIIYHVLKEEDMNQTAAAARLGIGRTTLWRKLQDYDLFTATGDQP